MYFDAKEDDYELITLFDIPMLFTNARIDRKTVPKGLYVYDVRHDDDQQGLPVELSPFIFVNHWGTVISKTEIDMIEETDTANGEQHSRYYRIIDPENDWNYEGIILSLYDFAQAKTIKELLYCE